MAPIWITVLGLAGLLALAVLMVPAAKRLNFPYTVLLAGVGCGLGILDIILERTDHLGIAGDFLTALGGFGITSDAVLFIFLPVLIFDSALSIDVRRLMEDIAPILLLAVVGVLISTFMVGYAIWWVSDMGLVACLLLGAIVSATDPVAVIAIFKDLRAPKRLTILVEGESLFNDATAIVMFSLLVAMITGNTEADVGSGIVSFLRMFFGGIFIGYVCGIAVCSLFGLLGSDLLVKTTLTISLAYFSFIIGEHYLHLSGVMALVTAALVTGSHGRASMTPEDWSALGDTWEVIGFWANSIIFILVGMTVPGVMMEGEMGLWWILAVLIVLAFTARACIIFGLLPLISLGSGEHGVSMPYKWVMHWGGLRGAVSLALALMIMENPAFDPSLQNFIGILVTGLVLFTLFVNATTIGFVLRFFGLNKLSPVDRAIRDRAKNISISKIIRRIESAVEEQGVGTRLPHKILEYYKSRVEKLRHSLKRKEGLSEDDWVRIGLGILDHQERKACLKQLSDGMVSPHIVRYLTSFADDIFDGLKAYGVGGYRAAVEKTLGFGWRFHLALWLQRRLGVTNLLTRQIADRFEILSSTRLIIREVLDHAIPEVVSLAGNKAGNQVQELVEERLELTEQALRVLELQYPAYARAIKEKNLNRAAIRLEEAEYQGLLEDDVIGKEVFLDLQGEIEKCVATFITSPDLDLGLNPFKLVEQVPFFKNLSPERIAQIVQLLKPRLVIPGEKIIGKGNSGEAMFFISNGCVEVKLPEPVQLGSGDFFGEIALVKDIRRTADVTASGFCDLLVLYVRDFRALVETNPEIKSTIDQVAQERLHLDGLE
ncbi:hypothetical protein UZ36_02640 [Candidatus Nitromaritima sp. SCGC AAA799-C22]|nr:hypothetical protein UZ36_02640 [Candidatus Nitromaritima sp. SCGC AAA799-C22]